MKVIIYSKFLVNSGWVAYVMHPLLHVTETANYLSDTCRHYVNYIGPAHVVI